jgi:hypothetical protein
MGLIGHVTSYFRFSRPTARMKDLRILFHSHSGPQCDAHRGDRDRQPSDGRRTNGDTADRTRDLKRGDAAHRRALAPHAVHARTGQGGAGLETRARLAARRVGPARSYMRRSRCIAAFISFCGKPLRPHELLGLRERLEFLLAHGAKRGRMCGILSASAKRFLLLRHSINDMALSR